MLVVAALGLMPVLAHAAERHRAPRHHRTIESQADRLNDGQLDRNYHGPWHYMNGTRPYAPDARYVPPPALGPSGYVAAPPPRF